MQQRLFGEVLTGNFAIPSTEIEKALKFQGEYGGKLGEILLNSGVISEEQLASALAMQFGVSEVKSVVKDFSTLDFAPLQNISPDWFITNELIPLFAREQTMYFALNDPLVSYPIEVVRGLLDGGRS